ncbi:MAG: bifunctional riboflavin kinase/FAD synthetase [Terracidiphilus sp.]|nr:bifunctional riboflavin kinase/FAD synthetase [Terracidiphilus sp.]MDR3776043.1 bifunctional riboflavin kinase/FAD synthetase [Terracidiphilus sp.]
MSDGPARMIPVYHSVAEVPAGPSVVAIGNFDGVHLGHREILSAVVAEARALGVRSVAVTFDPHPQQYLHPAKSPRLLTPMAERVRLLAATGIDAVLVLRFDAALASLPSHEFVQGILVEALGVRAVHEGGNFRFGHRARAGVAQLQKYGAEFGFAVHVHSAIKVRGLEVSSSALRALVAAGDMRRARWMLGRPFAVLSTPARGRGIGTRLLVPTVNLAAYDGLLPAFGVYITRLIIGERRFQSVTNVGNRPTFGAASFAVESHILDFEPVDLDEQTPLELEFLLRLRPETEWPSPEALKAQIFKDVAKAQRYFHLAR